MTDSRHPSIVFIENIFSTFRDTISFIKGNGFMGFLRLEIDYLLFAGLIITLGVYLVYIISRHVMDTHNKLQSYTKELEMKNMALNHMFEELKNSKEKISKWSDLLEQAVIQKTASIRNLLNSAGQGFLSFGRSLVINDEYSSLCTEIFGCRIEKKNFPELVYSEDSEQKEFLKRLLERIFSEKGHLKRETLISLLPEEAVIRNRNIHIGYKVISNSDLPETIMIVLTDITDKRRLENQIEQERNLLKMVVKIVVHCDDFIDYISDYMSFCRYRIYELLQSGKPTDEIISSFFRTVHTFKGSFSQLDSVNIVSKLHELESLIIDFKRNSDSISYGDLRRFILGFDMQSWLEMDLAVLRDILGKDYVKQLLAMDRTITIDKQKIIDIENKIISILPEAQQHSLLPLIRRIRYRPFKSLIRSYPEYVARLSERLEKPINPLVIEGGDIVVFPDRYAEVAKSLVNVFRNIMDHGIETPEERLEKAKEEFGNVKCSVSLINNKIFIMISDDGKGINLDEIKIKAVSEGILSYDDANDLSDSDLLNLIFMEGFTTKPEVNEFSGRGVGLTAVKSEVEKAGGTIKVLSEPDKGTEFHIILPFEEIYDLPEFTINDIMCPLIATAKRHIISHTKSVCISPESDIKVSMSSMLSLFKYTTFIDIRGVIAGKIALSFDENLANLISCEFLESFATNEEKNLYIEDSIAESANIILGNSINKFAGIDRLISIESPVSVLSNLASFKFPGQRVWTCTLVFDSGKMCISFISA